MIITNSSPDTFYYDQLLVFLTSMSINSPKEVVHVYLAKYPEDKINTLKKKFPSYIFDNRELKKIDDRGFSFILFRAELILECFSKYNDSVAWIDTDVIVRRDLNEFLSVTPQEFKILYRGDNKPDKVKINAGIFNIGCSIETHAFMLEWYERIQKNAKWGMGQLELWRAYKNHEDDVILCEMDEKYNDLGGSDRPHAFSDESVMWHCKKAHFNHPKFQNEFKYYLDKGRKL